MKPGWWQILLGIAGLIWAFLACRQPSVPPAPPVSAAPPSISAPAPAASITGRWADGRVTLEGTVADDATRARIVDQAKTVYGNNNVVDRLSIDAKVGAPRTLVLTGAVPTDAIKQAAGEGARKVVGSDGTVDNRLTIAPLPVQKRKIDELLEGKTIEFALGSAVITEAGRKILDQVAVILQEDKATRVEISGHTDNLGDPKANEILSDARADATQKYLVTKGVAAERLTTRGFGQEKPIADNATPEGQQRNRRIEFHVQEGK